MASAMFCPCETRTSTCRNFATISSGLCCFLGILVLLDAKRHTSGRTTSKGEDHYGGDLLQTPLPGGDHFYNRIEGPRYDFTARQFDQPLAYMALPTSTTDARRGTTSDA